MGIVLTMGTTVYKVSWPGSRYSGVAAEEACPIAVRTETMTTMVKAVPSALKT